MSWRPVILCGCLGVAIGCTSGHADNADAAATCPDTSMMPLRRHLGDGVNDYHYYPIVDYLRENPGSESNTRAVEREEREAEQSPHDLKPASSGIIETEFSHLLGAIARDNGGIGAAVFDTTGLMVAAAGFAREDIVLPADRLATLTTAPGNPPVEVHYSCDQLRRLSRTKHCRSPITVYYRPVIDYQRDSRVLGFSMLVVENKPPCKDDTPP